MLLRPGNAGSNTFTDHREVLAAAIRQVPARFRRKILVRVDGAGASHELVKHLLSLSSPRRRMLFTCGWMITAADEDAIAMVPAGAWKPGIAQDGTLEEDKAVAEITRLMSRAGNWPGGLRWIVRRVKPSRRQMGTSPLTRRRPAGGTPSSARTSLTPASAASRAATTPSTSTSCTASTPSWRPAACAPPRPWGCGAAIEVVAGQLRVGHRREHRRRPRGLDPPPRLQRRPDLRDADPDTLRYRIWHIPARLAHHARQRILKISPDWPWKEAFLICWQRLCALPAPA